MKNYTSGYLLIIFLAFLANRGFAQNYTVNLVDKYGTSLIPSTRKATRGVTDVSVYKNLDTANYNLWAVRCLVFNSTQSIVESAIRRNVAREKIRKFLIDNKIDTSYVNYEILKGNTLSVFVGVNTIGYKTIIIDVNHNNDFNDDKKYIFDLVKKDDYPTIKYALNYYDGQQINSLQVELTLDPYTETIQKYDLDGKPVAKTYGENSLNVTFLDKSYLEGFLLLEGNKYQVNIRGDLPNTVKNNKWLLAVKQKKDTLTKRIYTYYPPDTLYINRKIYKVENVAGNKLYIKKIGILSHDNGAVNTLAPPIEGEEINTGKFVTLAQKRGKFTIVDFWGSWCVPCISALPELVALKDKYSGRNVGVLSVAFDDKKDLDKLKTLIIDKKLKWDHLLESKNGDKRIINDYLVQAYPTTLLIDPTGRVVVRGIGASVFKEIDAYLTKYIK